MILKKIILQNIRSHKKTEINFERGINVFLGGTGSGKTSILIGIEFALFGKECGREYSEILRRGSLNGKVILEFEKNGKTYRIERGLSRVGNKIEVDKRSLKIYENGKLIFWGGSVTEMNEKIRGILGFPKKVRAINLFETLVYSRQDEIRKIIEMKKEERQDYIDKALLLDKYKKTWENMKDVIDLFKREYDLIKIEVRGLDEIKRDIKELEERIKREEEELREKEERINKLKEIVENLRSKIEKIKQERDVLKEKYDKIIQFESKKRILERRIETIKKDIKELEKKITPVEYNQEEHEFYLSEKNKIEGEIYFLKRESKKIESEIEKIKSLSGKKECPLCKQEISEDHIQRVTDSLKNDLEKIKGELLLKEEKLGRIMEKIRELERLKKIFDENKRIEAIIDSKKKDLEKMIREIEEIEVEEDLEKIKKEIETKEAEISKLSEEYTKYYSELRSLEREIEVSKRNLQEWKRKLEEKKRKFEEIEKKKKLIEKYEKLIPTLENMRESIRDIRRIIREKFIEDFRREFNRWFEEIRRERYYRVDINDEYEPMAYTPEGVQTSIRALSGGERTSVALAYRLALSSLVAKLRGISGMNLLILDEPTVGLDEDDIRILPEILRKLELDQIIIVTHSRELKEAGDVKFLVRKIGGVSEVKKIED